MSQPGGAIFTERFGFIMAEFYPTDDQVFLCVQGIVEDFVRLNNEERIMKYRLRLVSE